MNIDGFFPIYDLLFSQIDPQLRDEPLKENEMIELISKINNLDKFGKDMIYVFIRIHSLRNSDSKILDIPYGGEKINEISPKCCDVKFDIRTFPPVLVRMINRFIDLHIRKQMEESKKNNF